MSMCMFLHMCIHMYGKTAIELYVRRARARLWA